MKKLPELSGEFFTCRNHFLYKIYARWYFKTRGVRLARGRYPKPHTIFYRNLGRSFPDCNYLVLFDRKREHSHPWQAILSLFETSNNAGRPGLRQIVIDACFPPFLDFSTSLQPTTFSRGSNGHPDPLYLKLYRHCNQIQPSYSFMSSSTG